MGSFYDKIRVENLDAVGGFLNYFANTSMVEDICHCTDDMCYTNNECVKNFKNDQRPYPKADTFGKLVEFVKSWPPGSGYVASIKNDPLARYGNSYLYWVNNLNSPTEYILKATLSDKNSSLLNKLPDGLVFSNVLPPGIYNGVDCQSPAYCLASGNVFRRLNISLPD